MNKEKITVTYNQALFDGIKADLVSFAEIIEELFFSNMTLLIEGIISENSVLPIQYKKFKHSEDDVKLSYILSINDETIGTLCWKDGDLQSTKEDLEKTADFIVNQLKRTFAFKVLDTSVVEEHLRAGTAVDFMKSIGYDCKITTTENSLVLAIDKPEEKINFDLAVKDGSNKLFGPLGGVLGYTCCYLINFVIIAIVNQHYKQDSVFEI